MANIIDSFSYPEHWTVLKLLVAKCPDWEKTKAKSRLIREGIELLSKQGNTTLDVVASNTPGLDLDNKAWKKLMKDSSTEKLRELSKMLNPKFNSLQDELYRRIL